MQAPSLPIPALMGILNCTPDSFSDGGNYLTPKAAQAQVDALLAAGADVIDIGGESTRPGAEAVSCKEQWKRVAPALTYALSLGARVSIDTTLPEVAEMALARGAHIVNDVSCLGDARLAAVAASHGAEMIIMHSRGSMTQMAGFSSYSSDGYVHAPTDCAQELQSAAERAQAQGLAPTRIWLDPGLGFHKNAAQSYELLANLSPLRALGYPVVVGASRKSFLAADHPCPPSERLAPSIAAALFAAQEGAQMLRVHDVAETRQALLVQARLSQVEPTPGRTSPGA